jgi:hypothetical protein
MTVWAWFRVRLDRVADHLVDEMAPLAVTGWAGVSVVAGLSGAIVAAMLVGAVLVAVVSLPRRLEAQESEREFGPVTMCRRVVRGV